MPNEIIRKFIRFGIIGALGMLIDYGTTFLFKEVFLIDKYIANLAGFTLAASSNYYLNRTLVFKNEARSIGKQYIVFVAIAAAGLLINSLIIWLLTDRFFHLNFYISKTIAIGVVYLWNFSLNYFLNFKEDSGKP